MRLPSPPKKAPTTVPRDAVVAMFKECFKRGPWPNEHHCFRLAIDINTVKQAKPQPTKHSDRGFAQRLAIFNAFQQLTVDQLRSARDRSCGLRLQGLAALELLEKLLHEARDSLLFPYDPLAGERAGSEWHKPARYIAASVEKAMSAAGHKAISRDKHSIFVKAVVRP
jgi:hypothetical protein